MTDELPARPESTLPGQAERQGPDLCEDRGNATAQRPACLSLETSMAEFSWKAGKIALLVCFWVTCQISGGLF